MLRVLIAEDEYLIRTGIIAAIPWHKLDMEVCAACENGVDALSIAREQQPDILITDLKMPGMDGLTLIRKLRRQGSNCKVIVITCIEEFETLREAMTLKISAYLLKATMTSSELWGVLDQVRQEFISDRTNARLQEHRPRLQKLMEQYIFCRDITFQEFCEALPELPSGSLRYQTALLMELSAPLSASRQLQAEEQLLSLVSAEETPLLIFHEQHALLLLRDSPDEAKRIRIFEQLALSKRCVCCLDEKFTENAPEWISSALARLSDRFFYPESFVLLALKTDLLSETAHKHIDYLCHHPLCRLTPQMSAHTAQLFDSLRKSFGTDQETFSQAAARIARMIENHRFIHSGQKFEHLPNAISMLEGLCRMLPVYDASLAANTSIASMCQNIRHSFQQPQQLNEAALSAHFSNSYFSMLFKKATGLSFTDYITATRLQNACELLSEHTLNIREISDQCGFSDVTYFARCFKKKLGVSPRRWRSIQ